MRHVFCLWNWNIREMEIPPGVRFQKKRHQCRMVRKFYGGLFHVCRISASPQHDGQGWERRSEARPFLAVRRFARSCKFPLQIYCICSARNGVRRHYGRWFWYGTYVSACSGSTRIPFEIKIPSLLDKLSAKYAVISVYQIKRWIQNVAERIQHPFSGYCYPCCPLKLLLYLSLCQ